MRPSTGSLEADAEAALVAETVESGMRRTSDYRIAMRGVAAAGWHYFLSGGNFEAQTAGGPVYIAAMADGDLLLPRQIESVSSLVLGARQDAISTTRRLHSSFIACAHAARQFRRGNALERDLIGNGQGLHAEQSHV